MLAILAAVMGGGILVGNSTAPADAVVRTFLALASFAASWLSAVLGALCGWVGSGMPRCGRGSAASLLA
jgi:hypothetical protein